MQVSLDSETVLIEFEDRNLICSLCSIIKIQAVWRGAAVRKKMLKLRNQYEAYFKEIQVDEHSLLHVCWPKRRILQHPRVLKAYDYQQMLASEGASLTKSNNDSTQLGTSRQHDESESPERGPKAVPVKNTDEPCCVSVSDPSDTGIRVSKVNTSKINTSHASNSHNTLHFTTQQSSCEVSRPTQSHESPTPRSSCEVSRPTQSHESPKLSRKVCSPRSDVLPTHAQSSQSQALSSSQEFNDHQRISEMNEGQLLEERRSVAMELLWIQQAIDSRKQYLQLKTQVTQ